MKNNSVATTCKLIYPSKLARCLGVTPGAIQKTIKQKYFTSDWYEKIVILTNKKVTYRQLYSDLYLYKYGIIPQVIRKNTKADYDLINSLRKQKRKASKDG